MRLRWSFAVLPLSLLLACSADTTDSPANASQGVGGEAATEPTPPADPPPATTPAPAPPAPPKADVGAVFTISNDATANAVVAFERAADGSLKSAGTYATGGRGTGAGLGSQGALALSSDGKILVVVDAGSNEISSFAVDGTKLDRRSRVSSTGTMPISVTIHDDLVYVLNAGDTACIAGFRLDGKGALSFIPDSKHSLSTAAAGPAQVSFTPKGDALVVSEKATNVLDSFVVRADGTTSNGEAHPSSGMTPFGFAFSKDGVLVVSEAAGAAAGLGTASSYTLDAALHAGANGMPERGLVPVSRAVLANTTAPCWVAITGDGKLAVTSNTPSGSLSTFGIAGDGSIALAGAEITTGVGSKPVDLAFDGASKHLYVLNDGTDEIITFDVGTGSSLTRAAGSVKIPAAAFGLVAR